MLAAWSESSGAIHVRERLDARTATPDRCLLRARWPAHPAPPAHIQPGFELRVGYAEECVKAIVHMGAG